MLTKPAHTMHYSTPMSSKQNIQMQVNITQTQIHISNRTRLENTFHEHIQAHTPLVHTFKHTNVYL